MPSDDDQIQAALQHYRTEWFDQWTDRDDDGTTWTGDIVTEWQTEYDLVSALALDPTVITNASQEGESASGVQNFTPSNRLRALQLLRAEIQPAYAAVLNPTSIRKPRRAGYALRFSPC